MPEKENPSRLLGKLVHLRRDYDGAIPAVKISNDGSYKVRRAWFNSVNLEVQGAIEDGYASEKSRELYQRFKETSFGENGIRSRLTTPEDISAGDTVLDSLIEDLGATLR